MNLFMRITAVVVLGIITANCGNNNKSDNRVVLSSQSEEDRLVVPSGDCEDCILSKSEVEKAVADHMSDISTVSDLSFNRSLAQSVNLFSTFFIASFTIQTNSGSTYANIQCNATTTYTLIPYLYLEDCSSEEVVFDGWMVINLRNKFL